MNTASIADMVKPAATCFRYYIMLFEIEIFIVTLLWNLTLRGWRDTLTQNMYMYRGKNIKFSTLHLGTNDEKFGLHQALIYYFSSNRRYLRGNPWAGLGSDKYLVWPKKCRFVCHMHKGDDPSCDFLITLYREWKAMAPKQNPGGNTKKARRSTPGEKYGKKTSYRLSCLW